MSQAQQVYYSAFDADFFALPGEIQRRIVERIDEMGRDLRSFPHYRMTGSAHCRLRVGDYRVIYQFDTTQNEICLVSVGHRREIYR